jgi:hypothetical protein
MSKKVRLTPELETKYREWLRAQRAAGLAYAVGDEEVPGRALTDADSASVAKWMREADVAGVEFEEEEEFEDDTEPVTKTEKAAAPLTDNQRWWFAGGAVVFLVAVALALLL